MGTLALWIQTASLFAVALGSAACRAAPTAGSGGEPALALAAGASSVAGHDASTDAGTDAQVTSDFLVGVQADWGWQPSGIAVRRGDLVDIRYVEGAWNGDGLQNPTHGPDGPTQAAVPAHANYPLPGAMEDSLIGRVGESVFFVGSHVSHIVELDGELDFTINDTGHSDNHGMITIRVGVFTRATER